MLWIDKDNALDRLNSVNGTVEQKSHLESLIRYGFAVFNNPHLESICDTANQNFKEFKQFLSEIEGRNLSRDRVVNIHADYDSFKRIGANKKAMEILDLACEGYACAYTSLAFEYGTEQPIHRDCPHFFTTPIEDAFFGVWTALEDIEEGAGELEYYVGGHKLKHPDRHEILRDMNCGRQSTLTREQVMICQEEYQKRVREMCEAAGLAKERRTLKKGESIIWHSRLPHGGSPITKPDKTRLSVVFHCIPEGFSVYNADRYFNRSLSMPPKPYKYEVCESRRLIIESHAKIQRNYI